MPFKIRRVDYFYTMVEDQAGEAYNLLSLIAKVGINLLAFTAVPVGPKRTQLTLFPEDTHKMEKEAKNSGLILDGPHRALIVQGDDVLGAFAGIHEKLFQANVNVYASSGVADGIGSYGYVLYIRQEEYERAVNALEV